MSEPPKPRVLVIMDVDGTMIKNGDALRVPFYQAFEEVTGANIRGVKVNFAGNTDRAIIRQFIEVSGVNGDYEDLLARFADRFCELVDGSYDSHPSPRLLPGVRDLLEALRQHPEAALVLGTGNIRRSCEIKLRRFELLDYFPHGGGFGGDHEVRADAIRAAMEVGREAYGWDGEAWVIGDTPNDAIAAHDAGARTLLVATGMIRKENLEYADAEHVLDDLTDTARVMEILGLA
ncbi:HAD hydrolase-like protein [bacterium]|nr:HAD hydrolase-like protein [bacterium]